MWSIKYKYRFFTGCFVAPPENYKLINLNDYL